MRADSPLRNARQVGREGAIAAGRRSAEYIRDMPTLLFIGATALRGRRRRQNGRSLRRASALTGQRRRALILALIATRRFAICACATLPRPVGGARHSAISAMPGSFYIIADAISC